MLLAGRRSPTALEGRAGRRERVAWSRAVPARRRQGHRPRHRHDRQRRAGHRGRRRAAQLPRRPRHARRRAARVRPLQPAAARRAAAARARQSLRPRLPAAAGRDRGPPAARRGPQPHGRDQGLARGRRRLRGARTRSAGRRCRSSSGWSTSSPPKRQRGDDQRSGPTRAGLFRRDRGAAACSSGRRPPAASR